MTRFHGGRSVPEHAPAQNENETDRSRATKTGQDYQLATLVGKPSPRTPLSLSPLVTDNRLFTPTSNPALTCLNASPVAASWRVPPPPANFSLPIFLFSAYKAHSFEPRWNRTMTSLCPPQCRTTGRAHACSARGGPKNPLQCNALPHEQ